MNPLSALVGGGVSATSGAKTGDASAGLDLSWNYNAPFQVGGSGKQTQDAGLTASPSSGGVDSKTLLIAAGIAAVALLGVTVLILRK